MKYFISTINRYLCITSSYYFFAFTFIIFLILAAFQFLDQIRQSIDNFNLTFKYIFQVVCLKSIKYTYNIFPYLFLMTFTYLFYRLKTTNEFKIIRYSGISHIQILSGFLIPIIILFLADIFLINPFYTWSQINLNTLQNKTLPYTLSQSGIWIRYRDQNGPSFINTSHIDHSTLNNVHIISFDNRNKFKYLITAKSAKFKKKQWHCSDVYIIDKGKLPREIDYFLIDTTLSQKDLKKLTHIRQNVSFFNLRKAIQITEKIGLSSTLYHIEWYKNLIKPFYWFSVIAFCLSISLYVSSIINLFLIMLSSGIILFFCSEMFFLLALYEKINSFLGLIIIPLILSICSLILLIRNR